MSLKPPKKDRGNKKNDGRSVTERWMNYLSKVN